MKTKILVTLLVIFAVVIFIHAKENVRRDFSHEELKLEVVKFITQVYSPRQFTDKHINNDIIIQVLEAGHKAPSAGNVQPWHFTVIRDHATNNELIPGILENNVLIVISGQQDSRLQSAVIFDCGLATQNMFLAAQALGVGSRIYMRGVDTINQNMLEKLAIPENFKAVMVLRLAYEDENVDALSAASTRVSIDAKVNFVN